MYTCKKCGEEFMNFDDYQEHQLEHLQSEHRREMDGIMAMLTKYMEEIKSAFTGQAAYYIASACLKSGKSADEGIMIYREVLDKLTGKD